MKTRKTHWKLDLSVLCGACLALVLAAGCEDDNGGPSAPSELAAASASAGPDQIVLDGAAVTLDGSASHAAGTADDPEGTTPASYAWVQDVADADQVTLTDADTATPDFTAPTLTAPATEATLNFTLTVGGKTDTVAVTVQLGTVGVGPDTYVGGYGKQITITPVINVPGTADQYEWTMGSSPVPAEWSPSMDAAGALTITTPLLTDLKIIPDTFGVLPIGALNISRADISGSMSLTFTAADNLASPTESYSDTLSIQIVDVTSGGTVVPVKVPCFLNAGATMDDINAITNYTWAGTGDLTQPDGSTPATGSDQVVMFVPPGEGTYFFTCGRATSGLEPRTVNNSIVYDPVEDETVITITPADLVADAHIGWECTFGTAPNNSYDIVENDVATVTVDGNASGESDTDAVDIIIDLSGTQGLVIRAAEYVGVGSIAGRTPDQDKAECASCHKGQYDIIGDQVTEWAASGHNQIFQKMFTGGRYSKDNYQDISCLHCHTTGFNETDTSSNDGFDDRAAATGVKFSSFSGDAAGLDAFYRQFPTVADLAFVQCEACHGPGSTHNGDTGGTAAVTLTGMCAQCHEGHGHAVTQWERGTHRKLISSTHATQDCSECHAGQGLPVKLRGEEVPDLAAGEPVPQNCGTCHDTHSLEMRAEGSVTLPNGVAFDFGHSAVCANCHDGRRDTSDMAALAPNMPHHGSQQAPMLAGTGAFEYAGYNYVNGPHVAGTTANPAPAHCNDCHMAEKKAYSKMYHGALSDMPYEAIGGHTWKLRFGADGTTLVDDGSAAVNVGTRELKITGAAAGSFVGLVEIGDTITFDGSDGGTFAVQAVLSADTVLVEDPDPAAPTMFAGTTAPTTWSITRDERELVEGCQACHTAGWPMTESLLIGVSGVDKNWDGGGIGSIPVQTRIQTLLDDLLAEIEAAIETETGAAAGSVTLVDYRKGRYEVGGTNYDYPGEGDTKTGPTGDTTWDAASDWESIYKATYNYFFVWQDHSGGIHNPGYAVGLLRSSYLDLTGAAHAGVDYTAP